MLIIKAFTKDFENWGEEADDFFISYQIDIGPEEIEHESYLYTIDIISPYRLEKNISDGTVEIGRGYFIMNDFNSKIVQEKILRLINICDNSDYQKSYVQLSKYMRWEMD